jgi:hypothetical protein
MNENSFRFLDNEAPEEPIWSLFDHLNQRIPETNNVQHGQMSSVNAPEFGQQLGI